MRRDCHLKGRIRRDPVREREIAQRVEAVTGTPCLRSSTSGAGDRRTNRKARRDS
jgi:hypothetical protein